MSEGKIQRISRRDTHWLKIYAEYVLRGEPFILEAEFTEDWPARKEWLKEGILDKSRLLELYGEETVPVVHAATGDVTEMRFGEYMSYCSSSREKGDTLYLKDWHFQKQCGGASVYQPPPFLLNDWVNNEQWTEDPENPLRGDYRFLYFGVKGTWTGFHSDVLSSHSWSANICGRKLWLMVPRGKEKIFSQGRDYVRDIREKNELWEEAGVFSFIQEPGEVVFVPSNHFHQVHNLETTVSLNHNSINASNVGLVWEFLRRRAVDVEEEIGHLKEDFSEEEWRDQVQLILGADACLNFPRLSSLLQLVIGDRSSSPNASCYVCPSHLDPRLCSKSSDCLSRFRTDCSCSAKTCPQCEHFIRAYELSIAVFVSKEVEEALLCTNC